MYYIYILQSQKNGKKYIGFTAKSVEQRLKEHNSGSNAFTRKNRPFELIHSEEHQDKHFARQRERFLKTGHGRNFLKRYLDGPRSSGG